MRRSPDLRVLVAPDKFKASATAEVVADAVARGIRRAAPRASVTTCPVADGGDGTVDVLLAAGGRPVGLPALDALGRPVDGVAVHTAGVLVLELARLCGLARLGEVQPLRSGSAGLGVALRAALERGHRDVVLALGGSASTDGGLGLLLALGATAVDAAGRPVSPDGAGLLRVAHLDLTGLRMPPGTRLRLACDVDAPLHGPRGAAAVFAPQKGAGPAEVAALDAALVRWGRRLVRASGRDVAATPGAGAAGGIGAAGLVLGAEIVGGASLVLDAVGFDRSLADADLVVTGEGSWDAQSRGGKAPGLVAERAGRVGVPVALVAGRVAPGSADEFVRVHSLVDAAGSVSDAMSGAVGLLEQAGAQVGLDLPDLVGSSAGGRTTLDVAGARASAGEDWT